jgi:hypothetical protein
LVVVDIEGGELDLLDPNALPSLSNVKLLVETHDEITAGCLEAVRSRFARTHDITSVQARPRALNDLPAMFVSVFAHTSEEHIMTVLNERLSHQQEWLYLRPTRVRETCSSDGQ